ncbi:hypothetical protein Taro_042564 [Colocasia esculenta]|uniref:non-specific serine/threonine protein kinase n=1 Tax=Colocasia esculenta TaxID=4460 RepID=A0A843WPW8_COLES|nr:hypothetical protein [Colocasia esculenta]
MVQGDDGSGAGGEVGERKVVFGKYEMGRLLGKGTFAKVYYGKELATGESVAIKVISKEQVKREPGMVAQIVREISIMRLVRHPNVVELREVMATKARIFFVMEHVRGGELFARVARGKLREDEARRYFQQLVSAVDFCHSRGVSHRDLKPENLLLDDKGDLKVSDFGLSALPEQLRHDGLLHTQCGTPAYVAPEVLRKKGYDGTKADLWSCGVILYVLLAGFLPFQDENLMRLYRKVFKAEYEFPPWFSTGARRLISRLLVADPEKRISVPEIVQDPWFRKGFSRPIAFSFPDHPKGGSLTVAAIGAEETGGGEGGEIEEEAKEGKKETPPPPAFYNAFELISTMGSGFDLSGLFEEPRSPRRRAGSVFTSRWSASAIAERLERVGRALGFRVRRGAKEDEANPYKLRLEGGHEGRKGRLAVAAEVFEVAPGMAVVEFSKSAGDTLEYVKFCEEDVRPGLKDVVWTWQGDGCRVADADADADGCYCGSAV